jgi:hypothetical protein
MVVENISTVEAQLSRLIQAHGGYLAETNMVSYSQMRRTATWKVRVPVDHFDAFLAAVIRLGELQKNHVDSQDVTEEFFDLDARITNKQREEQRLLKHLSDSTGKLDEILAVEREISRVRGEVEQMQGRLRYLSDQTALSTVAISATELKDYTPPVIPTFGTQIGRTFRESIAVLTSFGKGIILIVVAVGPWLPLVVLAAVLLRVIARRVGTSRPAGTP